MEFRLGGYSLPFMMVLVTTSSLWPLFFFRQVDAPLQQGFSAYLVPSLLAFPVFFAGVFCFLVGVPATVPA